MVVRASGYNLHASVHESFRKSLRVIQYSLLIDLEGRIERLFEADRLRGDHVLQRATLNAREDRLVQLVLVRCFLICQNQTASGSAQRFMCCCRDNITPRERAGMQPCRDSRNFLKSMVLAYAEAPAMIIFG